MPDEPDPEDIRTPSGIVLSPLERSVLRVLAEADGQPLTGKQIAAALHRDNSRKLEPVLGRLCSWGMVRQTGSHYTLGEPPRYY